MAQLLYFACSRKREYLADACGAQFTRYPEGLASALEKISQAHVPLSFASQATAPMFIVNPLYAATVKPNSVFSSHPPTSERIRVLRGMTGASFADYEAAYRRAKGGSLIGASTLRAAPPQQTIRAPPTKGRSRRDRIRTVLRTARPATCGFTAIAVWRFQFPKVTSRTRFAASVAAASCRSLRRAKPRPPPDYRPSFHRPVVSLPALPARRSFAKAGSLVEGPNLLPRHFSTAAPARDGNHYGAGVAGPFS